jgi:hypothetical protein
MTDAERIAKLLKLSAEDVNVTATYADPYYRAWEGKIDIAELAAMLADVRSEEREASWRAACADILGALDKLDRDCDDAELFRRIRSIVRASGT